MSTIADTAPQTHDTLVRLDTAGKPLAIRHDGRIWLVDPDTDSGTGTDETPGGTPAAVRPSAAATWSASNTGKFRSAPAPTPPSGPRRSAGNPPATHWLLDNISDADKTTEEE
jgi:hypothetical protein